MDAAIDTLENPSGGGTDVPNVRLASYSDDRSGAVAWGTNVTIFELTIDIGVDEGLLRVQKVRAEQPRRDCDGQRMFPNCQPRMAQHGEPLRLNMNAWIIQKGYWCVNILSDLDCLFL
jgi:hypothetical protein